MSNNKYITSVEIIQLMTAVLIHNNDANMKYNYDVQYNAWTYPVIDGELLPETKNFVKVMRRASSEAASILKDYEEPEYYYATTSDEIVELIYNIQAECTKVGDLNAKG